MGKVVSDLGYERDDISFGQPRNPRATKESSHGFEDKVVRALERSRDYVVKVKVEDFRGYFDADTFLDWLDSMKHFFEWKELYEDWKVKFMTKLKGATHVW